MSKEHYFLVRGTINADGQVTFVIDHDTGADFMPDGSVWDTEGLVWLYPDDELDDDRRICQALTDLLTPAPIATVRHLHVIIDPEQHEETE